MANPKTFLILLTDPLLQQKRATNVPLLIFNKLIVRVKWETCLLLLAGLNKAVIPLLGIPPTVPLLTQRNLRPPPWAVDTVAPQVT